MQTTTERSRAKCDWPSYIFNHIPPPGPMPPKWSFVCERLFQEALLALRMLALSCQAAAMDILGRLAIHFMWHEERIKAEVACGNYELASIP